MRIALIILFFLGCFGLFSQENQFIEGELLVMLKKGVEVKEFSTNFNQNHTNFDLELKDKISQDINVWLLSYNKLFFSPQSALDLIKTSEEVTIAQFNHINILSRGDTCPNDPNFYPQQWSFKNTGQNSGVSDVDIDACKAWGITTSDTSELGDTIVVAVIDEGFYLPHSDLNYFVNRNEIYNNGIDDDGNGLIDDSCGWNLYADTNVITTSNHGTRISGIIGAKSNNGVGVAGINWGMKILPIQGSSGAESLVLKSYSFVLRMRKLYDSSNGAKGAFIVATNSSFGVNNGKPVDYPLWCAFYDSLGAVGILNSAATSNSNVNVETSGDIPTTCTSEYMIAVNNTTRTDNRANSGYGNISIDMGAPGTAIYSTISSNSYSSDNGTSYAAPHVAGSIAFMYAVACKKLMQEYKLKPDSVALEIRNAILNHGDSIPSLAGITVTGKRLNLFNSANAVRNSKYCSFASVDKIKLATTEILLYPNPNPGIFNLKLSNFPNGNYTYSIFDISGKMIHQNELQIASDNQSFKINEIANFDLGVYFLCLKSVNFQQKIIKFVKNK